MIRKRERKAHSKYNQKRRRYAMSGRSSSMMVNRTTSLVNQLVYQKLKLNLELTDGSPSSISFAGGGWNPLVFARFDFQGIFAQNWGVNSNQAIWKFIKGNFTEFAVTGFKLRYTCNNMVASLANNAQNIFQATGTVGQGYICDALNYSSLSTDHEKDINRQNYTPFDASKSFAQYRDNRKIAA